MLERWFPEGACIGSQRNNNRPKNLRDAVRAFAATSALVAGSRAQASGSGSQKNVPESQMLLEEIRDGLGDHAQRESLQLIQFEFTSEAASCRVDRLAGPRDGMGANVCRFRLGRRPTISASLVITSNARISGVV